MRMTREQFMTMMTLGEGMVKTHSLTKDALDAIYEYLNRADYEQAGYPVTKERVVKAFREGDMDEVLAEYVCSTVDEMDEEYTWACALPNGRIVYDADQ